VWRLHPSLPLGSISSRPCAGQAGDRGKAAAVFGINFSNGPQVGEEEAVFED
jgi:hypothetical protein